MGERLVNDSSRDELDQQTDLTSPSILWATRLQVPSPKCFSRQMEDTTRGFVHLN
jgi:hypothetical protein